MAWQARGNDTVRETTRWLTGQDFPGVLSKGLVLVLQDFPGCPLIIITIIIIIIIMSRVDDLCTRAAQLTDLATLEEQVHRSVNAVLGQGSSTPSTPRAALPRVEPLPPLRWVTRRLPTPVPPQRLDDHAHSLSLSKLQPKKALRCARNALLLDLPLARGSISGLGSRDIQPTPPPLMRPPRSATALPPRLPAPVPSPPSTTRTPASLASCPLRPSTLTLSSHNERRLVFSANGSHHHLDVCRPRCSVHWARTYQRSQTQRHCKRFMPLVTSTLADPAARIYLACRPFRGCHVTVEWNRVGETLQHLSIEQNK